MSLLSAMLSLLKLQNYVSGGFAVSAETDPHGMFAGRQSCPQCDILSDGCEWSCGKADGTVQITRVLS